MKSNGIVDENGQPVELKNGDVLTTEGGYFGLGHAAIVKKKDDTIEIIEVLDRPQGDVHVGVHRTLDQFMEQYEQQDRSVFLSRPKKPDNVSDTDWQDKLQKAVKEIESKICTSYPIADFILNVLWNLPDIWYCSELIYEAFKKQSIDLSAAIEMEDSTDNVSDQRFLRAYREAVASRLGDGGARRFLGGFRLPPSTEARLATYTSFEEMVASLQLDNTLHDIEQRFNEVIKSAEARLSKCLAILCTPPLCYELSVQPKNIKLSNITQEALETLGCALLTDNDIRKATEEKVKKRFEGLSRKQECRKGCACLSVTVLSITIQFSQHITEVVQKDLPGPININCKVTFDLSFDIEVKVSLGPCIDLDKLGELPQWLRDCLDDLKSMWNDLTKELERLFEPEELAKKGRRITPKQLRENNNVEKPVKIKRRRP